MLSVLIKGHNISCSPGLYLDDHIAGEASSSSFDRGQVLRPAKVPFIPGNISKKGDIMAIPNPNPNIADGIKSDNKTYSSNKIESLIKTATELPIPEAGDAGKVLTVNSDLEYDLESVPSEVPTPAAGDAGKVLTVNAGATDYELDTPVTINDSTASASTVYSSNKVDSLLSVAKQESLEPVEVNGTLQLSADVLAHTFVNIQLLRGGAGGSVTLPVEDLYRYNVGIDVCANAAQAWAISFDSNGLLTLAGKSSDLSEPYIRIVAFL